MAALYRSVICACSVTWSWTSVARIDRDVNISAMTAARPGNAATEICIQSRGCRVLTGRSRRAQLGHLRRRGIGLERAVTARMIGPSGRLVWVAYAYQNSGGAL